MTIRLCNYSGNRFRGWKRCTTDTLLPGANGDGHNSIVVGDDFAPGLRQVDCYVDLEPGEVLTMDPHPFTSSPFNVGPLPADPVAYFGLPSIGSWPLDFVSAKPDGACWSVEFAGRFGTPMLHARVWLRWYPDMPAVAEGEIVVTASNPSVPDVVTLVPGAALRFGDALVYVAGKPMDGSWITQTMLADGQAISMPIVLVWKEHLRTPLDWSTAGAIVSMGICANGLSKVWPQGNPRLPTNTDAMTWSRANWGDTLDSLRRWTPPANVGVNARSNNSGAVADQVFVGAETLGTAGLGAETVLYFAALAQSKRPCHHLEADGTHLDLSRHPNLRFWDGRPHWHHGVSPDQLGKGRGITELDTHGWWGVDVEHCFANTLVTAARLTGSRALQWQLEHQARILMLQFTHEPGVSTSQVYSSRALGWMSILAVQLYQTLEDRTLAEQIKAHLIAYYERVVSPWVPVEGIWDVRMDDARLGTGPWFIPWQQAVGCYGLDLAAEVFQVPPAREAALRAAQALLELAWRKVDGRWLSLAQMPVQKDSALCPAPNSDFNVFGLPMGLATILRHDPQHAVAREIWGQCVAQGHGGGSWFAPECLA